MKTKPTEIFGDCRLSVREEEHGSFTEFHLTATEIGTAKSVEAAAELYARVAATLAEKGIQTIQEKLYGTCSVRDQVLDQRAIALRKHGLDPSTPISWIQGRPLQGCDFIGIQLWGVVPHDGETSVQTVPNPTHGSGRLWTGRGFRMLHLPCVRGELPSGELAPGETAQAEAMFENAGAALAAHGMDFRSVVRTWIYLARLLDWYIPFNGVRTEYLAPLGMGKPDGPAFPASTGIQGQCGTEACVMDVLALENEGSGSARAIPIRRSPRQDSSFNYGSSFSRGMVLEIEGKRTIHISGTASIDQTGATVHAGDPELQCLEMLMCIAAILRDHGGDLRSIRSATLFCKDRETWMAWNRVTDLLKVPAFPVVCMEADICRPDLLVEMEAVAVV